MKFTFIYSAGIQAGHFLAVDSAHWLDNIKFQKGLTMEMTKVDVTVRLAGFSTVESVQTQWPLFAHPNLTWKEFVFGVMAEIMMCQVSTVNLGSRENQAIVGYIFKQ